MRRLLQLYERITEQAPSRSSLTFIGLSLVVLWVLYHVLFASSTPLPAKPLPSIAPVKAPVAATPAPKTANNETDRVILSLFKPTEAELGQYANENALHERYHTVYISIYLLKGCGRDVTSYHAKVAQRFAADWATLGGDHANQQVAYNALTGIIEEARSSYSLLYENTPCDKRNLPALEDYFQRF